MENRESAGGESADQQGTKQTWRVSDGDSVNLVPIGLAVFDEAGLLKGLIDDGLDGFQVGTSGDLWNNAAVGFKDVNLGDDDIAQNLPAVLNNGGGSFVARSLNPQNIHFYIITYFFDKLRDVVKYDIIIVLNL